MSRKHFKRLFSRQYEKDWIKGYVYDSSVNYDAVAANILDIHKYLMKKNYMI